MFDKLKPLPNHIFIPKIVPLVYDDTLSYYEFVCKLMVKLEEIINTLNDLGVRVDALEDAVRQLQEIVNSIDDRLTACEGDINDIKGDIHDINTAIGNINTAIDGINIQLGDLTINVRNNSNAITQINSAISDIRDSLSELSDLPGDVSDLEDDLSTLDNRVTQLESATFGDVTVSPTPKNFCVNMLDLSKIDYEIVEDFDVRDPDWDDTVQIDWHQLRFRGNENYNKTHLVLKNFCPVQKPTQDLTLALIYDKLDITTISGQVKYTTFADLLNGINCMPSGVTDVCIGGAKLVLNDYETYDLHLYVEPQNGAGGMISNSRHFLKWIVLLGGIGYITEGKIDYDKVLPYLNAYNMAIEPSVSQSDFDALSTRVTGAEGDIDDLETAIGTFTQSEYNSDWNIMNGYVHGIDDRVTTLEGEASAETVETWVTFSDVFENSVIPEGAIIHHFRMDKKGRMVTFELGMINVNDNATFRYNSYNLGQIRSGLRTKLAPAMDTPVMFTGMLGGTDNNDPKGYMVSGSIPATTQNPPMPDVTGIAIASLYGAVGTNYYTSISTYGNLPPYSLIVKLVSWSVTSQSFRNSFIIRGTYLTE